MSGVTDTRQLERVVGILIAESKDAREEQDWEAAAALFDMASTLSWKVSERRDKADRQAE